MPPPSEQLLQPRVSETTRYSPPHPPHPTLETPCDYYATSPHPNPWKYLGCTVMVPYRHCATRYTRLPPLPLSTTNAHSPAQVRPFDHPEPWPLPALCSSWRVRQHAPMGRRRRWRADPDLGLGRPHRQAVGRVGPALGPRAARHGPHGPHPQHLLRRPGPWSCAVPRSLLRGECACSAPSSALVGGAASRRLDASTPRRLDASTPRRLAAASLPPLPPPRLSHHPPIRRTARSG